MIYLIKLWFAFGEGLASYRNTGTRPTKERYKMNFSCNLFLFQALHWVVIKPSIGLSLKEKNSKEKKDKNLAKNTAIRAETERHEFDKGLRKEHGRNRAQWTQIKERSCHAGDLYLWNYNLWDCIHCFLFVNIWRIKNDDLQTNGNLQ